MKQLINQYKNNIKKIIYTMTGAENEDIEQEVCIRLWRAKDNYKEQGRFKSWLNTITANLCRDYLKSAYYKNAASAVTEDDALIQIKDTKESVENEFMYKLRRKKIIEAIESLKPKFKEVIIMYEMHNMSYEEISKKLNVPSGTVRSRLFNARKELGIMLKDVI